MTIQSERYLALDVLRGMTIAFMILVNTPGSWSFVYPPLLHAQWHGCTPTDLVFPFFLFVVGVSMFFSFAKTGAQLNKPTVIHILRRSFLIFIIGLFINSFPQWITDFSELRIMGVLQRIAVAYLIGSLVVLAMSYRWIAIVGAANLILYWGIIYFLGGEDPYSLQGNVVLMVDRFLLGESHMYHGFRVDGIPIAFDPEGMLSSLPAVSTVIMGYLAGKLIRETEKKQVPFQLIAYGALFTILGSLWDFAFPINKPLWSSSYVLFTGGLASIFLGCLVYIIDIKSYTRWTHFFKVFGVNPLFIFALSGLVSKAMWMLIRFENAQGEVITGSGWLYNQVFVPLAGNLNGSLLYAITHVVFFWLIGYILYKKRIFIKV